MADSIPICDVLSEAMEYMSKLGTNIRIRSENLREKRIRKDKLRNTHAIHKAVDKVLLICELSKKSIENVETGVKNLLLQMEKAGSSFGPGPETRERPSDVKFEYFTYESRRLKIRNKISVGHYTSVKVVSTSMTLPVLEKYPVYHDCKLYRMRKKKKRREMQASIMDSCTTTKDLDLLESSEEHTKEKTLDEIDKSKNTMIGDQTINVNEDKNDSKNIQNSKYDNLQSDNKEQLIEKEIVPSGHMKSPEEDNDDSDFETKYEKKKHRDKTKKFKHVKIIDDDSSNSDKESLLSKKTYSKKSRSAVKVGEDDENSEKSECNSEKIRPMIKCVDKTKKFKHVKVIDDDSSNSDKESLLSKETYSKKSQSAEKVREDDENSEKSECNSEKIRPMIKCVSLDKLLKPERVKSYDDENKKSKKDKSEMRRERHSKSESRREERPKRTRRLDTSDEEDDYAYWARKQKEVKQFKAKDFRINVNRLPKITTMLLECYNLTRITHNGSVLCEKVKEISASESFSDEVQPKSKRMKISNSTGNVDLDKAKSALLDDSDSDISEPNQNNHSDAEMIDIVHEHTNLDKKTQSNIEDLATDGRDKLKSPEKSKKSGESICESEVQNYKLTYSHTDSTSDNNIQQEEKNESVNSSKEIGKRENESKNNFIANRAEDNTKDDESNSNLKDNDKDSEGLQEEVCKDKNSQQIGFNCETNNGKNVDDSTKSKDVLSDSQVVSEMSTKLQEEQNNKNSSDDEIVLKKSSQMVKKTLKNMAMNDSECDVRKKRRVKRIVNRLESDESDTENETKEKTKYETDNFKKSKKISLDNQKNIQFEKEILEDQITYNTPSNKLDNEDNKEEQSDSSKSALSELHDGQEEDKKCNNPEHLDYENTDTDMPYEETAPKDSETLNDYSGTSSEVKGSENERDKGDLSVTKDHFLANRSGSENEERKQDKANSPRESDHNTRILEKQDDFYMSKSSLSESEYQNKEKQKNPGNGKFASLEYNKAIPNQSIKSREKPKAETENLSGKNATHEVKKNLSNECDGDDGYEKTDFNKTEGNANKVIDKVRAKKSRKTFSNEADTEASKAEKNRTIHKEQQYQNDVGADKIQKTYSKKHKCQRSCTQTNSDEVKKTLINATNCDADTQEDLVYTEKKANKKTEKLVEGNSDEVKKTLFYESDSDTCNQESAINTVGNENEMEKQNEINANNVNTCQLNESDSVANNRGKFSDAKRNSDKKLDSQDESEGVNTSLLNETDSVAVNQGSSNEAEKKSNKETENQDKVNSEDIKKSCPNESDSVTDNRGSCNETELNIDEETENQDEVNLDGVKESHLNESDSEADKQESCNDSERYAKEAQNQDQVNSERRQSASDICYDSERNSNNEADNKDEDNSELHSDKEADNVDKDNSEQNSDNQADNQNEVNTEEVKQSLLNESDSDADKQESSNTERNSDKGADNTDEENSELNSDKETENPNEVNTEEVKQSLLNESDSDADKQESCNIERNPDKETEDNDVNTEEIKKSLLNQSDSDIDNEENITEEKNDKDTGNKDEHNAEEIKKSLLNESDSDADKQLSCDNSERYSTKEAEYEEEVNAEEVKKSLLNESDSDADNQEGCIISNGNSDKETVYKPEVSAEEIKKSLLNESDSDADKGCKNSERNLIKETGDHNEVNAEEVKKSLLNESDSDVKQHSNYTKDNPNDEKDNENEDHADELKKSLLNESDCNTNIEERCIKTEDNSNNEPENQGEVNELEESLKQRKRRSGSAKDTEIVKSSLLKDSSDDRTKTPIKRKSFGRDSPPQSKRKHIMESMYARKMLLTYSSSSDTEDEQLRNTLKEIKNYLLKGVSSDEGGANESRKNSADTNGSVRGNDSKEDSSGSDELSPKKITKPKAIKRENSDSDSSSKPTCGSDSSSKKKMGRSRATRAGSCSQNSDMLDDKEIDGLTNLKSLKKSQRRRDSSTDNTQSTRSGRRLRMAKAGGLISNEGFLQAESSSDAASLSGSDHADNVDAPDLEEMPRVKLSDINGDGIVGHLAKDDLLGESDTSVSHDEKKDSKRGDDTDDDRVKSKRRKGLAISSDSEAGSSRRKDHIRLSDFEDSEDESSEPVKSKRKKKGSDSDASGTSSEGKKKRRRIKTLDDSDVSGSDTENEGRNKHGRKNIRKVMGKNQLEEATKKAAREEKERIARIAERQKLYNNLEFDESGKPDEVVLEKVVLDFDPETKEPLIQVDRGLVKKLKPHQANGIKFMWDACFESVKRIKKDKGSGCILAHCMGLGKTLQVVSLTHTLLTHGTLTGVNRVLVVCPLSTVLNWVNEFRMWLKHAEADFDVDVYELSKFKQNSERAFQLSQWFEHGGVCVLGYEMFRNLSADNVKKFKKKMLKNFQESLVDPGPDLVVCDEGHLLKNEKTSLSQSMNRVKTRRRIVLTGTPLQNNLKEYYCMVQFVKPNLLGKYNEYLNRFVNPITNGQYTDSTEHDIRVMKRRSHVLHKMLDGAVQRRDYGVLAPFLPPKHEYVLFITLTDVQIKLYQHYLDNYSRRPLPGKSSGFLFPDFQSLQRIWTHPLVLKYNSERYEIMQQKKREREEEEESEGSLLDFINDDSTPDESSTEESTDDSSDLSDDSRKKSKKKKAAKKSKGKDGKATARRGTRANPIEGDEEEPIETLEVKNENPTEWWMKLVSEDELEDMRNSSKLVLLFDILRQCEAIGDKLLVFSQSLYSLDLIEHFLGKVDDATQEGRVDEKLGGHVGSWSPGVDYFRLDGSTSCENRSIWCKNFNREDNPRARLFLISTRAGGLGINLVAANRVVIFDVSWNPSHDVQSIFRVYRFGQKKPCYIYRFLAMGTMEEKIYERQVTKQAISKRVIDEQQIDRHYAENDLAELYKFEPQPPVPRPLPPLPKDRLFAEMLREHEAQIYKYHEHDSLLENKEEETLSEEERKAAWEDFENEKTRPPPPPLLSPYAMHNGMMPGLIAQQQQLMYAAVAAMVRKDMPNMNDQQIRDAVSLIYNANANPAMFGGYDYGAMQKIGDLYKYAQPGMMNPGMMNAMNPASGVGGAGGMGMGGASGLQYEPPWQRQQQQQQQMRLQQLMQQQQQQNSMGAKYYAGGLGSRDPMAMALQQQRARELMLRPRARGRPPLQPAGAPRPPPAHAAHAAPAAATAAGDVVNLDSD